MLGNPVLHYSAVAVNVINRSLLNLTEPGNNKCKFFVSKKCPLIDKTKMKTSQQDAFLWGCSDWSDVNDL